MHSSLSLADPAYRRALGEDLVLRWSTAQDIDSIVTLYEQVFRDTPDEPPNTRVAVWTRDMMSGRHPLIGPADFAVVENSRDGTILASTCLLSQVWTYAGIDLPVGRPEAVATHIDYRGRGLIRAIFALIHARGTALGHVAQGITGIEHFYRQFGYEYALDLDVTRRLPFSAIPHLKEGTSEPFHLREATLDDISTLEELYNYDRAYALTSTRIDTSYWRWMLAGVSAEALERWRISLIVDDTRSALGYVVTAHRARREGFNIIALGVAAGVALTNVLPSVLRALRDVAATAPHRPLTEPPTTMLFGMSRGHAVYEALGDLLPPAPRRPYSWYVRVPDVSTFVQRITPVLEQRLSHSVAAGYSGEIKIDFYRGGLRLVFGKGRLEQVAHWQREAWDTADAGIPGLVFLQLLFGYRSLDELRDMFPDVWASDSAAPLLRAVFPPRPSWVIGLD